jgi:uncharacterized membrane protein
MYGFSKDYQDPAIFNYVLYGLLSAIFLGVIVAGVAIFIVFSNLSRIAPLPTPDSGAQFSQNIFRFFMPFFLAVIVLSLVPALFNMFAFKRLSNKSGVRLFRTVGLLGIVATAVTVTVWFLGAALFYAGTLAISNMFTLSIAGSVVNLAAWILAAKAFRSITVPTNQAYRMPSAQAPTPPATQAKYCPYCGAANTMDAEYCVRYGKKL